MIESPAGGVVTDCSGELARGHDLSPREDERAPIVFSVAEDRGSGFILGSGGFSAGEWTADGRVLRLEDRAGVVIFVQRAVEEPA